MSINNNFYHTKHAAGLNIFIIPQKGNDMHHCTFAVKYGSIDNQFITPGNNRSVITPDGAAHFLEHKIFGVDGGISEKYAVFGGEPHSYTTFTNTGFSFSTGDVKDCFSILALNILHPEFTDEGIIREREKINQEIINYKNNPMWILYYNILDCLYLLFPVKKQVAGTLNSVAEIDKNILYSYYKTFYNLSNSTFLLVGDVKPDEIIHTIESTLYDMEYENADGPVRVYPHEPVKINMPYKEEKSDIKIPMFLIGIKDIDTGYSGKGLLKKEIEIFIILDLLFGKSSDFYIRNYTSELIDESFSFDYVGGKDYGHIIISGESKEPVKIFEKVKKIIIHGKQLIKMDDMESIKIKLAYKYLPNFKTPESTVRKLVDYYAKGIDLFNFIDILNTITPEDLRERFDNCFQEELIALSVIYPDKR